MKSSNFIDKSKLRILQLGRILFRYLWIDTITVENTIRELENTSSPFCFFSLEWTTSPLYTFVSVPPIFYFSIVTIIKLQYSTTKRLFNEYGGVFPDRRMPSDRFIETLKGLYQGCVSKADEYLYQIRNTLSKIGELENTIIVVFGDHGELFGEDRLFTHGHTTAADLVVHVPLVIYDPTKQIATGLIKDVVQLNNLHPNLLNLVGIDPPETNSINILDESRDLAYSHIQATEGAIKKKSHLPKEKMPSTRQVLLWENPNRRAVWLPNEDRFHEVQGFRAKEELDNHKEQMKTVPTRSADSLSEEARENLKDLGYL